MDVTESVSRGGSVSSRELKSFRKKIVLILLVLFIVGNIVSVVVGITRGEQSSTQSETEGIVKVLLGASTSNVTRDDFKSTD